MNKMILAGAGIAALAVTSGNQTRRHERQKAREESNYHKKPQRPPIMPTQSSEMYHDEAAALAASISSYGYGSKMSGYMT